MQKCAHIHTSGKNISSQQISGKVFFLLYFVLRWQTCLQAGKCWRFWDSSCHFLSILFPFFFFFSLFWVPVLLSLATHYHRAADGFLWLDKNHAGKGGGEPDRYFFFELSQSHSVFVVMLTGDGFVFRAASMHMNQNIQSVAIQSALWEIMHNLKQYVSVRNKMCISTSTKNDFIIQSLIFSLILVVCFVMQEVPRMTSQSKRKYLHNFCLVKKISGLWF